MFFMKVRHHFFGLLLSLVQKGADGIDHLTLCVGASSAHGIGFDVLIQEFIGIQLGTVAGKVKQLDSPFLFFNPMFRFLRAMYRMPIHNNKQIVINLSCQTTQKGNEDLCRKSLPI